MGLMMLGEADSKTLRDAGLKAGSRIRFTARGPDAAAAMDALSELFSARLDPACPSTPILTSYTHNISHEEIVELQKKFSEIKSSINNVLAVMMALSEMSQRRPDYSEKLASTVLTKAPLIVSRLQEFTQALNEKAGPKPEVGQRESCISLASLFPAEQIIPEMKAQIIPEMKATEHFSAIVELTDLLVAQGKIKTEDRESILASLKQREEEMSTGIGFGAAIPHARSDRIEELVVSFGRSSQGIEFDALDNAPVKFVLLFIVPKNQFQTHLRSLASIAKFLSDRSIRESLAAAKTADEILAIFRERGQK